MTEVICLYQHLCSPIEGHLYAVYRIFRYLQKNLGKNPVRITYDPMYEPIYENVFEVVGIYLDKWKDFYPESQEMVPIHMPEAFVKYVVIKAYLGSNHAGNVANMRSHYVIIIYVNNEPII